MLVLRLPALWAVERLRAPALAAALLVAQEGQVVGYEREQVRVLVPPRPRLKPRQRAGLRRQLPGQHRHALEVAGEGHGLKVGVVVLHQVGGKLVPPVQEDGGELRQFPWFTASNRSVSMRMISSKSS